MPRYKAGKPRSVVSDEWYTQTADIHAVVSGHASVFKHASIICPADTYTSGFYSYFKANAIQLDLKSVIFTSYTPGGRGNAILIKPSNGNIIESRWQLSGDGDMLSQEVQAIIKSCDVCITNPPFSLSKKAILALVDSHVHFFLLTHSLSLGSLSSLIASGRLYPYGLSRNFFTRPDGSIKPAGVCFWATDTPHSLPKPSCDAAELIQSGISYQGGILRGIPFIRPLRCAQFPSQCNALVLISPFVLGRLDTSVYTLLGTLKLRDNSEGDRCVFIHKASPFYAAACSAFSDVSSTFNLYEQSLDLSWSISTPSDLASLCSSVSL